MQKPGGNNWSKSRWYSWKKKTQTNNDLLRYYWNRTRLWDLRDLLTELNMKWQCCFAGFSSDFVVKAHFPQYAQYEPFIYPDNRHKSRHSNVARGQRSRWKSPASQRFASLNLLVIFSFKEVGRDSVSFLTRIFPLLLPVGAAAPAVNDLQRSSSSMQRANCIWKLY